VGFPFKRGVGSRFKILIVRLAANLTFLGVDPASLTKIIFTHAYPDHSGETTLPDGALPFPNADIKSAKPSGLSVRIRTTRRPAGAALRLRPWGTARPLCREGLADARRDRRRNRVRFERRKHARSHARTHLAGTGRRRQPAESGATSSQTTSSPLAIRNGISASHRTENRSREPRCATRQGRE